MKRQREEGTMTHALKRWLAKGMVGLAAAALAAVSTSGQAEAVVINWFGRLGFVPALQTAQLNVVNLGGPDTRCSVELMFFDNMGNTLAAQGFIIEAGHTSSLDLNARAYDDPDQRHQFRAAVNFIDDPQVRCQPEVLASTLELVDNDTHLTAVVLNPAVVRGFNPQPDPPGTPAGR
jgi:hypothetical protein